MNKKIMTKGASQMNAYTNYQIVTDRKGNGYRLGIRRVYATGEIIGYAIQEVA